MKIQHLALAMILGCSSVALVGCGSGVRISSYPQKQMMVRGNLTPTDIEERIRAGIARNAKAGWYVENSDANKVTAGFTHGRHYLQVTYFVHGKQVFSQITDSQNLNQKGDVIHKNAMAWKLKLDKHVYAQLMR